MEVTLAIGIIAFALLALFALIPVGMSSGREAIDATHTSLIATDVQNRVRSAVTSATFSTSNAVSSRWFYGRDGVLVDVAANGYGNAFYRADSVVHGSWGANPPPPNADANYLRPVTINLAWPVNTSTGNPIGSKASSFTFFVRKP